MLDVLKDYPEQDIETCKDDGQNRYQKKKVKVWLDAFDNSTNPFLKQIKEIFINRINSNDILKTIKSHEIEILRVSELEKGISEVKKLFNINDIERIPITGSRNLSNKEPSILNSKSSDDIGKAHVLIGSILEIVDAAAKASCEFKQTTDVLRLQAKIENENIAYYKDAKEVLSRKVAKMKSKHEVSEKERFQEINDGAAAISNLESEEKRLIERLKQVREEIVSAKKNQSDMKDRTLFGRLAEKTKISIVSKDVAKCENLISETVLNQNIFNLFSQSIKYMIHDDGFNGDNDEMPSKKKRLSDDESFSPVDLLKVSKSSELIEKIISWLREYGSISSSVFARYLYEGISVSRIIMKKYANHEIFSNKDDLAEFMKSLKYIRIASPKKITFSTNNEKMKTLVLCDPRNLKHLVPKGFPERSMRIIKIIDRLIKLENPGVMSVLSNDNLPVEPHTDSELDASISNEKTDIRCMSMNDDVPMHDSFYACISLAHADGYLEFLKERCATAKSLSKSHIPIKDTAVKTINSDSSFFDLDHNADVDFTESDLKAIAETMSNDELPSNYQKKMVTKSVCSSRSETLSLKIPQDMDNFSRLGDSPKSKGGDGSKSKNSKSKASKKKDDDKKEIAEKKVELIWSCPNCTFDNDASLNPKYCEICNHRRPGFTRQQSRGQTPRSDNIIDTPRSRSKIETTDRSQKGINSSSKKIVTWACPLCEYSNDIDNDNCGQCSSPRSISPRTQNSVGFDIHIENSKDYDNLQVASRSDNVVEMVSNDSSDSVVPSMKKFINTVEVTVCSSEKSEESKSGSIGKTPKNITKSIPSNNDVLILDSRAKRQREVEGNTESKVDESQILDILEVQNINQRKYIGDKWMGCNDGTVVRGPGFWNELDGEADTYISPESFDAAIHAAFVVCSAVDAIALEVISGSLLSNSTSQNNVEISNIQNAFCCIRPPGHHAGRFGSTGGCVQNGFCLLNNVAIAAYYARIQYGYRRVAIVDIDAHFGNGTAEIFDGDPHTFYSSIHLQYEGPRDFFYPSTTCCIMGADIISSNNAYVNIYPTKGPGFNINSTEPKLRGREGFRKGFAESIIPALIKFDPDIIFVSAGFDGASSDPVGGQLGLKPEDFHWSARLLRKTADDLCGGRLISVLEGGYDIAKNTSGLAKAAEAHVLGIAGQQLVQ